MIELFLILYVIFWIAYYTFEGLHDANVILWQESTENKDISEEQKRIRQKYSANWHEYDSYEKALTHVVVALSIYFVGGGTLLFITIIVLALSIRLLVHNYIINKTRGFDINYIGETDWFDLFLRKMENKGISQWTIKIGLFVIFLILTIILI